MTQNNSDPLLDKKNQERISLIQYAPLRIKCWEHLLSAWRRGIYLRVTQTLRTFEEQDALYQLGRTRPGKKVTNARAGSSWHNYGLAYDVVILDKDGKANWNTLDVNWKTVGILGESFGLEWGGRWEKFKDYPHFEYPVPFGTQKANNIYNKKGLAGVYASIVP